MFFENGEIHLTPQQTEYTGLDPVITPGEWLFERWLSTEAHLEHVTDKVKAYSGAISVHEQGPVYNHMSRLECSARVLRAVIGYASDVIVNDMEYATYVAAKQ